MKLNKKQQEIIQELTDSSKSLSHSPKRRDVPNLAWKCYQYLGSFNKAKQLAGLDTKHKIITEFPEDAFKLDKDMAAIAGYLMCDGHIYKNFRGLFYASRKINDLKDFEKITSRKFNIKGKYRYEGAGSDKKSPSFYLFNKIICQKLVELGIPKGDKVIQSFSVPKWIKENKELSREYLKIAFLCEGSWKENNRKNPRIQINFAKAEEILDSGFYFMNELKEMLLRFEIKSTECKLCGKRVRKKDGKISRDIRFRIVTEDNHKFIKEIGWLK